jgi:hypothetical protein
MDAGRRSRRRNAEADEKRVGDDTERHPKGAVDDLRCHADGDEGQQVEKIESVYFAARSVSRRENRANSGMVAIIFDAA